MFKMIIDIYLLLQISRKKKRLRFGSLDEVVSYLQSTVIS